MALRAAIDGLGVSLGRTPFVEADRSLTPQSILQIEFEDRRL
jgi:hypothetical protein